MADVFQVPFNVPLRAEPRNSSGFTVPKIEVDPSDKLEIVGTDIPDPVLPTKKWVKVKCAKGEGFLDRKLLTSFAALYRPGPTMTFQSSCGVRSNWRFWPSFVLRTLCFSDRIPRSSWLWLSALRALNGRRQQQKPPTRATASEFSD